MYYEEVDNYIDGGYLANNPCQAAWTEIHNYLPKGKKLDPALIVSVGIRYSKGSAYEGDLFDQLPSAD